MNELKKKHIKRVIPFEKVVRSRLLEIAQQRWNWSTNVAQWSADLWSRKEQRVGRTRLLSKGAAVPPVEKALQHG